MVRAKPLILGLGGATLVAAAGLVWALSGSGPPNAQPVPHPEAVQPAPAPPAVAPAAQTQAPPGPDYERCVALAIQDPAAALLEAARFLAEGGGDAALHCEAMALLNAGEDARAAERLERLGLEGIAPRDARAAVLAQAGQLWLGLGDLDRAYAAATQALILRPDDADMLTDRAVAAASIGRFTEAIDDLSRSIDLRPGRAEAYVLRASAWRQSSQPALAADDIARALAIDRTTPDALLERGLLKRDARDFAGARADWEEAIRLAPESPVAELAAKHIAASQSRR